MCLILIQSPDLRPNHSSLPFFKSRPDVWELDEHNVT